MELIETITTRRSIRRFKEDPVSDDMIHELLEAARLAPSGSNIQPWRFIILKSPESREKLRAVTPYHFIVRAPVVFVCCADITAFKTRPERITELRQSGAFNHVEMNNPEDGRYGPRPAEPGDLKARLVQNVAIAVEHIVLRAVDLGLGTCWIGRFNEEKVKEVLDLDENIYVFKLLPVGYPDGIPGPRPRLPLEKLVLKTL